MTQDIMIVQGKFRDKTGEHTVSIFEQVEDDEATGRYRCLVDDKEKVYLDWTDNIWYEEGIQTERAKNIGRMVEEYED